MPRQMTKTMVGTLGEWAAEFRSAARADIRFDYSEDEVDFRFDDSLNGRALPVHVQDYEGLDGGRRQKKNSGQTENKERH